MAASGDSTITIVGIALARLVSSTGVPFRDAGYNLSRWCYASCSTDGTELAMVLRVSLVLASLWPYALP
eukprot:1051548-Rhodomonas_salina.1